MRIDCPRFRGYEVIADASEYEGRPVIQFLFTDPKTPAEVVYAFQAMINSIKMQVYQAAETQGQEQE